jgi:hypothetical protein
LKCDAAPSLCSEWISNSDASTSKTNDFGRRPADHTRWRAAARARRIASNVTESTVVNVRQIVGGDATSPNTSGCSRNGSMSVTHRPPPASINAT